MLRCPRHTYTNTFENFGSLSIIPRMIIVTGAAGFIGSNVVAALNSEGVTDICAVDNPGTKEQTRNLDDLAIKLFLVRDDLFGWIEKYSSEVEAVIHLGACSDTLETDRNYMMNVNFAYPCRLWELCAKLGKRLIYASSAATYGDGSKGYSDLEDPACLAPLNLYGESKQRFDLWALAQPAAPPGWVGLKFFNVYGPREQHKKRMASVVFHLFEQIEKTGKARLFKSEHPDYSDGGQMRDFIYIKDAAAAIRHFLRAPVTGPFGLVNVGTGVARSYRDLALAVFNGMDRAPHIEYIPMPDDLRGRYQYFTQAGTNKLRAVGFKHTFHTLEEGVEDYVRKHLLPKSRELPDSSHAEAFRSRRI